MSIFDRKRSAPEPELEPEPEQPRYQQPDVRSQPQAGPVQPQPEPKLVAAPAQTSRGGATYGIQKAIELMRSLPSDNIPLIVQVVRTTLESTNIDVPSIIEDAKAKRARITARIESLRKEIANFEEEIAARREEIVALEADHAETKLVQERLEMGLKQEAHPSRPAATPTRPVEIPSRRVPGPAEVPSKPSIIKPPAVG